MEEGEKGRGGRGGREGGREGGKAGKGKGRGGEGWVDMHIVFFSGFVLKPGRTQFSPNVLLPQKKIHADVK